MRNGNLRAELSAREPSWRAGSRGTHRVWDGWGPCL